MSEATNLPGYEFVEKIGAGATSDVFLVKSLKSGENFACKVISRNLLKEKSILCCLERELRIQKTLVHPNIVKLWNVVYTDENVYLIMDYCENGDLLQQLNHNLAFIQNNIMKIAKQLLSALSYIHSKKIAHHDIKPENILFDSKFNAKLSDFGCAAEEITNGQYIGGTPSYMAPEIFNGTVKDRRKGDIYSLGLVLHEILFVCKPDKKCIYSETFSKDCSVIKCLKLMLLDNEDHRPSAKYLLSTFFKDQTVNVVRARQVFRKFNADIKRSKNISVCL